ncbi:MAG: signal recognition particle protein [Clostridia bacterium]
MAFEGLSEKLQETFKSLRGKGKLSEKDVKSAMREVRMALLQADVNFKVVKEFISNVQERAVGESVLKSITPGQQVIKIVNDELVKLLGGSSVKLELSKSKPHSIVLAGLQGAGKTTHAGKLAQHLRKNGRSPLLVACDIYRPAAIEQLKIIGKQLDIDVFSMENEKNVVKIAKEAKNYAINKANDVLIVDTAGRLHIDEKLMDELNSLAEFLNPDELLLVVDGMTGQDAVNVAQTFKKDLDLTGAIMTKLDGDTRGGAALSIRAVTGVPIKFIGTGEKLNALESFHPDRMASRILGMGDVLTLIEKAQDSANEQKMKELEEKIRKDKFTFNDFLVQLEQMKNMGPLEDLLSMIPGMGNAKQLKNLQVDDNELKSIEAIVLSMTLKERENPEIINSSRKRRIAKGSGTNVPMVNRLLKQFSQTRKMLKQFNSSSKSNKSRFKLPF